jgi:hypothetical protein
MVPRGVRIEILDEHVLGPDLETRSATRASIQLLGDSEI